MLFITIQLIFWELEDQANENGLKDIRVLQ